MIEVNKIYCENNLETMARMPDEFIDLVVTSPPYDELRSYNGFDFNFEKTAIELYRVTKVGGVIVWVVSDATVNGSETGTSFRQALFFKDIGLNLHDTMIYKTMGTGAKGSNLSYWQSFEYMFILSKGRPKTINRIKDKINKKAGSLSTSGVKSKMIGTRQHPNKGTVVQEIGVRENVWVYHCGNNGDDATNHPAVFPEQLAADHIHSWSNKGDLIYDPFAGSGTTLKMAHIQQRNWIGSEISHEYVDLANKRLKPYLQQTQLFHQ